MSRYDTEEDPALAAERVARDALADVRRFLPYLADLSDQISIFAHEAVPTAGVTADGRVYVGPRWFGGLDRAEALYVMAHELWHLALRSHARADGADAWLLNVAHDWIINDILSEELGTPPPRGGLELGIARDHSAEELVRWLKEGEIWAPPEGQVWREAWPRAERAEAAAAESALAGALRAALGDAAPQPPPPSGDAAEAIAPSGDLFGPAEIARLEPAARALLARAPLDPRALQAKGARVAARHALLHGAGGGDGAGDGRRRVALVEAVEGARKIPIELALQRGLDMLGPATRSYARPSRRQGTRRDVVLAGRAREGWALNILLDTSGSMISDLPRVLGMLRLSAEAAGVSEARLVQVSDVVTADDTVALEGLEAFEISGFGGSDLRPGFAHFAADPSVEGVAVITDMAILAPERPPPFSVLWLAVGRLRRRGRGQPPFGRVIHIDR